jgi:hypothetical protein
MRNQVTIHGQIVDRLGLVQLRSGGAQLRPDRFKRTHPASTLNLMHEPRQYAGRLAAIERDESGVWGTWTSDMLELLTLDGDVYVSGELAWAGRGVDTDQIELVGAALVDKTASTCTQPAMILCGDLTRDRDRRRWSVNRHVRDRLDRAAEQLERRRSSSDPIALHDEVEARAMRRQVEEENRYRSLMPPVATSTPRRGRPVPPQLRPGWKPGDMEWSMAGGRVLNVS